VLVVSAGATVSHYLAATATESEQRQHEREWRNYAACTKIGAPERLCQQPGELNK